MLVGRAVAMPIPVTVIGGYLGSGKTTLVNYFLRHSGLRIAVLVNEFGTLPIDEDLIEARDDSIIRLSGGCVCCSYGSDMMAALMGLDTLKPTPEHVLLEASGVALPGAVAQSVELLPNCHLDGTVVLADAETVEARATDPYLSDTITRQLAAADIVLLNKVDMVSDSDAENTRRWIVEVAPEPRILATTMAAVSPDCILGVKREGYVLENGDSQGSGHGETGTGHHSMSIELDEPVDAVVLARQLATRELDLIRVKGVVLEADGTAYVIQIVGRRWRVNEARTTVSGLGRLVCIRVGGAVNETAVCGAIAMATR